MKENGDARSKAAAVLGSQGGKARTPAKIRAARRNSKKGGWPQMGRITWTMRYQDFSAAAPQHRLMSAVTYRQFLDEVHEMEPGWSAAISCSRKTAARLGITPTRDGRTTVTVQD